MFEAEVTGNLYNYVMGKKNKKRQSSDSTTPESLRKTKETKRSGKKCSTNLCVEDNNTLDGSFLSLLNTDNRPISDGVMAQLPQAVNVNNTSSGMHYQGQYMMLPGMHGGMHENIQCSQPPQLSHPHMNPNTPPPSWAISLIEDVKSIKEALPKIDQIEKSLNQIQINIHDMQNKVTDLENKVINLEKGVTFINNEFEDNKADVRMSKKKLENLQSWCETLESNMRDCHRREDDAQDKMLELEFRSMRENLIFYGIAEPSVPKAGEEAQHDDCESKVKQLIKETLDIDTIDMKFDRAHRLGGMAAKKPRPIVVKFHNYADREKVRVTSHDQEIKKKLKVSKQGVGVQQPLQYRDARKILQENADEEEKKGHKTKIIGNKLLVDNKPFQRYINGKVQNWRQGPKS